jgi:hypothetical protein
MGHGRVNIKTDRGLLIAVSYHSKSACWGSQTALHRVGLMSLALGGSDCRIIFLLLGQVQVL